MTRPYGRFWKAKLGNKPLRQITPGDVETIAVEKLDAGYLSRTAPTGVDEEPIATWRLGMTKVTRSVQLMGLKYVVLTSVTRDDLEDGGSAHIGRTIRAVRETVGDIRIEALLNKRT